MFKMRLIQASSKCLVLGGVTLGGCAAMTTTPPPGSAEPVHPFVKVEGNDGTILNGELLNGSISVECGQGELTLLTDHIYSMTFDKDGDSVMSGSVKVFGKVEDADFRLHNEHGVFKLLKQNLHSIVFVNAPVATSTGPSVHFNSGTPTRPATGDR